MEETSGLWFWAYPIRPKIASIEYFLPKILENSVEALPTQPSAHMQDNTLLCTSKTPPGRARIRTYHYYHYYQLSSNHS